MKSMFFHLGEGVVVREDARHIRYRLALPEGEGAISICPVLPGIEVALLEFHAPGFTPALQHRGRDILEINHCLEGRIECRMGDGCLQYIGENDLFLTTLHNHSGRIEMPLNRYRGVAVMIDLVQAAAELERLLSDTSFRIQGIVDRLFGEDDCFLIQSKEEIGRIFGGMYTVPQEARSLYYRLKVLELLLYLQYFDPATEPQKPVYARQQVEIIKRVHKQITGEPGRHIPIEELAQQHCISATTLKAGFKAVYGAPVYAYLKEYRIRQAAELLRGTSKSVAEIAAEMGYGSQSKFGAAFKARMKLNPLEYRKKYQTL